MTPWQWPPPGYGWGRPWPSPPPFVPGRAFYALLVVVLGIGVVASSAPDLGTLLSLAYLMGLTLGLVWLIAFWVAAGDTRLHMSRRSWARWAGIPVMCFACAALISSGLPLTARFEASRPALEQAAVRAESGEHFDSGWIGLMPVHEVRTLGHGTLFVLSGSGETVDECGLAYSDNGISSLQSFLSDSYDVSSYGHGWWYWCSYPSGD